jgi:Flp pilus assembly protein TadD
VLRPPPDRKAVPLFRRKPSTWEEYFEQGMAFGGKSNFAKAEASFREAVRLAPEEPYPHYELGYTLTLLGRHEEALEELRRTEQLSRGFFLVETEIYLCEQLLSGSIDASVVDMLRFLQQLTDGGQGDSDRAVGISQKVIGAAPGCALGHFYLGKALFEREPEAADEALRRCLELEPDDTTAINAKWHIGALRSQAGEEDEARRIWREIADEYRGHPQTAFAEMSAGEAG